MKILPCPKLRLRAVINISQAPPPPGSTDKICSPIALSRMGCETAGLNLSGAGWGGGGVQEIAKHRLLFLPLFRCYQISSPNCINKFNHCTVYCKSNRKRDASRFLGILYRENFNRFIATNVSTNLDPNQLQLHRFPHKIHRCPLSFRRRKQLFSYNGPNRIQDMSIQKVSFGRSYHRVEIFLYFFAKKMD